MKQSLFHTSDIKPLAERMRPSTFDDVLGQTHLTAPGSLFRTSVENDHVSSIILFGPPGTGKTTLARLVARYTQAQFQELNAVFSTVQHLRDVIKTAQEQQEYYNRNTIIFIDEIHRWNKAQQEALLPWIENGTITLIGATTQNPFFELTQALLSRLQIFELYPLEKEHLFTALNRALLDEEHGFGTRNLTIEPEAAQFLVNHAGCDVRVVYNALEWIVETYALTNTVITSQMVRTALQKKAILYDRDGDYHYDTASAFIKSIRGSDPDAALFWASAMLEGGEDPKFILRRMLIAAAEDIGLADPTAIQIVSACAEAFDRVGMPEGWYFIAEAALYLATAPKSNSCGAIFRARELVKTSTYTVPMELRDASRDGTQLKHGVGYQYPHDYREHWIPHSYMPRELVNTFLYQPARIGFEKTRFIDTMLRHTDILISEDLKLSMMDAHGVTSAYAELINQVTRIAPEADTLCITANQGLLFARLSCIFNERAVHHIILPESSCEYCATIYFRDFEKALEPVYVAVPDNLFHLLYAEHRQNHHIDVMDTGQALFLTKLQTSLGAKKTPVVMYGIPRHKTHEQGLELVIKLLTQVADHIIYIEPLPFQRGLIPALMIDALEQKQAEALKAYDHAFFAAKETGTACKPIEHFTCTYHPILEAYAERTVNDALINQLFDREHEYMRTLPFELTHEQITSALSKKQKQTVQWRYAWQLCEWKRIDEL
ncbi:MAG TPA: replication-associated recombination protein A [Spirochaetia bacterium]|nr:replication-associated recombination protein A [Spirochaetales bacterium]HPD80449.1 replication-associated recombination protein A [Spirochaetales bacterium]HRS65525.1 replication-associated recombination protein A [Spirochaetia bacterium]